MEQILEHEEGPFIAASDYVRAIPEQIASWVPGGLYALGTNGFGRSDTRKQLRRFFEVDAEFITLAALYRLEDQGSCDASTVARAIRELDIDPEKLDPLTCPN